MQFEYTSFYYGEANSSDVLEELKKLGKEGWEYVGPIPGKNNENEILLKRRKLNVEAGEPAKKGKR